jgi:hypothetical protein
MQPTGTKCRMIATMSFCLITFYVTREVFKMRDSVSTREMETALDGKGGMVR